MDRANPKPDGSDPPAPVAAPGAGQDDVGRAVLAHLRGIEERLAPGLAAQVMPVFLRDMTIRQAALADAIGRADTVEAHRVAHTIHGSAASVGAATMMRASAEILAHIKNRQLDCCAPLLGQLAADLESVRRTAAADGITAAE